jgi:hypothetical protein
MSSDFYTFAELSNLSIEPVTKEHDFDGGYHLCLRYPDSTYMEKLLFIGQSGDDTVIVPFNDSDYGLGVYLMYILCSVVFDKETFKKSPLSTYGYRNFISEQLDKGAIDFAIVKDYLDRSGFSEKYHQDRVVDNSSMFKTRHKAIVLDTTLNQEQTKELAEMFINGVGDLGSFTETWIDFFNFYIKTGKYNQGIEEFCKRYTDSYDKHYYKPFYWKKVLARKRLERSAVKRPYRYPNVLVDDKSFETDGDAAITLKLPSSSELAGKYLCYATVWGQGEGVAVGGIFDEIPEYINVLDEKNLGTDNAINSFEITVGPNEAIFFEYLPNKETFIDYYLEDENHGMIYFGDKQKAYDYWSDKLQGSEDY